MHTTLWVTYQSILKEFKYIHNGLNIWTLQASKRITEATNIKTSYNQHEGPLKVGQMTHALYLTHVFFSFFFNTPQWHTERHLT